MAVASTSSLSLRLIVLWYFACSALSHAHIVAHRSERASQGDGQGDGQGGGQGDAQGCRGHWSSAARLAVF